ncbi:MAG: hypothetical protein FD129_2896 [bacterium]|nr:MAG: hypothetical protein FD129_2896 [bacterium]
MVRGPNWPLASEPMTSALHPLQNRLVALKKGDLAEFGATNTVMGTWTLGLGTHEWIHRDPVNGPGPTLGVRMLYDPTEDRMLVVTDKWSGAITTWFLTWTGISGTPDAGTTRATWPVGPAWPNPFLEQVEIPFELSGEARIGGMVVDAQGRLVRRLPEAPFQRGAQHLSWDGRDERGQSVRSGIYFVRLSRSDTGASSTVRVVRGR